MAFELFYWPTIQGRGEFVRLALEEAGADYIDVAREPESKGRGVPALMALLKGGGPTLPFAPPFLRDGDLLIGQTALILLHLGDRLGLAPSDTAGRLWAHQIQLTIADFVEEVHETHHPIATSLYYEDQKPEALRRAADFRKLRIPKYLGWLERVAERGGGPWMLGQALSYVDLSVFQVLAGLTYAFPREMTKRAKETPRLHAIAREVENRPRIRTYLDSPRRIAFNTQGIFRHYRELDG
jgi:glutathione S-transferase